MSSTPMRNDLRAIKEEENDDVNVEINEKIEEDLEKVRYTSTFNIYNNIKNWRVYDSLA